MFRIMYWRDPQIKPVVREGWFYKHDDDETGDPVEFSTLEEAQQEIAKMVREGNNPANLKIVQDYPFKVEVKVIADQGNL